MFTENSTPALPQSLRVSPSPGSVQGANLLRLFRYAASGQALQGAGISLLPAKTIRVADTAALPSLALPATYHIDEAPPDARMAPSAVNGSTITGGCVECRVPRALNVILNSAIGELTARENKSPAK